VFTVFLGLWIASSLPPPPFPRQHDKAATSLETDAAAQKRPRAQRIHTLAHSLLHTPIPTLTKDGQEGQKDANTEAKKANKKVKAEPSDNNDGKPAAPPRRRRREGEPKTQRLSRTNPEKNAAIMGDRVAKANESPLYPVPKKAQKPADAGSGAAGPSGPVGSHTYLNPDRLFPPGLGLGNEIPTLYRREQTQERE
jgi:hypothetical protein